MKKLLKTTLLLSAYLGMAFLFNCGTKDKSPGPLDCASRSQPITDAQIAYFKDQSKANCQAYKNAITEFYKSCSSFYTGTSKAALDEFLAEPCP